MRSFLEKIGEVGSKWFAQRLYSRPVALKSRYRGQPRRHCPVRWATRYHV
jgi:hypothetical protein